MRWALGGRGILVVAQSLANEAGGAIVVFSRRSLGGGEGLVNTMRMSSQKRKVANVVVGREVGGC
jgi:hypothetical protein